MIFSKDLYWSVPFLIVLFVRLVSLRHNPYVGTFHGVVVHSDDVHTSNVISEERNNPLIGVFRHSPSLSSKALGLKGLLTPQSDSSPRPVLSQLQISRGCVKSMGAHFVNSLKRLPVSKYSASSQRSESLQSRRSFISLNNEDRPCCSICLAVYEDGDEIVTLACSHCFHSECVNKWFFQGCLDNNDLSTVSCPQCRLDHGLPSASSVSEEPIDETINFSMLQLGRSMLENEMGYDFLSDIGSEAPLSSQRPVREDCSITRTESFQAEDLLIQPGAIGTACVSPINLNHDVDDSNSLPEMNASVVDALNGSIYSDCGVPLYPGRM